MTDIAQAGPRGGPRRPRDVGTTQALEAARPAESATTFAGTVAEGLAVVVAPSRGRFRPQVSAGEVEAGTVVGHVTGNGGRADEVRSPVRAAVVGLLARADVLVRPGQPLVWLRRLEEPAGS